MTDVIEEVDAVTAVNICYNAVLHRDPAAHEIDYFVHQIGIGMDYLGVVRVLFSSEEFRNSTRAPLFVPPGHFYSPIVDPISVESHIYNIEGGPFPSHLPEIPLDPTKLIETWQAMVPYLLQLPFEMQKTEPYRYQYDNTMYSWGDASILSGIINLFRPRRIIEIGSGWSSACMLDTVEHILNLDTKITFIEPYTAILRDVLGRDYCKADVIEEGIQNIDPKIFDQLEKNDILFIDSTHVLKTGSDVEFELFKILPRLKDGVIVHFHDMFWPFEYPRSWVVDENRSWNELYGIRAFLSGNREWDVLFFNDYMYKLELDLIKDTYPAFLNNSGGALWLQKTAGVATFD